MPSVSQTTPTSRIDLGDADRNGHLARRAASAKQPNSVTKGEWAIVTRTAYEQLTRQGTLPAELASDRRVWRLAHGRQQLGLAMLALDNVLHDHRPTQNGRTPEQKKHDARVTGALRTLRTQLEKGLVGYPLEVR